MKLIDQVTKSLFALCKPCQQDCHYWKSDNQCRLSIFYIFILIGISNLQNLFQCEWQPGTPYHTPRELVKNLAYAAVGTKVKKDLMAGNAVVIFAYGPQDILFACALDVSQICVLLLPAYVFMHASIYECMHPSMYCILIRAISWVSFTHKDNLHSDFAPPCGSKAT